MSARFEYGERLFLPVQLRPRCRKPGWPPYRPLWVYVLDPASVGLRCPTARIEVPYEPLEAGPCGSLFQVQHQPLPPFLIRALGFSERMQRQFADRPLNLEDPVYAVDGGVRPSTGEPLFAGQMAYAVCLRVYDTFARALGRYPSWGPWAARRLREGKPARLLLRPFAFEDANACYDAENGSIDFGVFTARQSDSRFVLPGGLVFSALSHDIIAHEMTHALLDGMRAHLMDETNVDVPAFHEAFADIVALFHHFRYREVVEQALEEARGGLNVDTLLGLARQFGEGIHGHEGGALRRAVESMEQAHGQHAAMLRCEGDEPAEPHERGAVLVAAVFSAYLDVFERKAASLFRLVALTGDGMRRAPPHELVELLADEACSIASEFLQVCIRAIDYCPPLDLRFGEYLRALVTADRALNEVDRLGIRDALIKAFRMRNIELRDVLDLSEYSLEWNGPRSEDLRIAPLAWSQLRFADDATTPIGIGEVERQAAALASAALESDEVRAEFGLERPGAQFGPIVVESIRPVACRSRDNRIVHGLVAELSQRRARSEGRFFGGATVVLDEQGIVRYAIRKRVADTARELAQERYRKAMNRPEPGDPKAIRQLCVHAPAAGTPAGT